MGGVEQTMREAPKKLSEAILLALVDLEAVEKNPLYKVYMQTWHAPPSTVGPGATQCYVCFAGSVMVNSLKTDFDKESGPSDFSNDWGQVFRALNSVRQGHIASALRYIHDCHTLSSWITEEKFVEWEGFESSFALNELSYEQDPAAFKDAMFDVATMLEVNDL